MATLDIELYYDLDRRRWTTSAGGLATQPSLFIGQSNTIDFKVRFVQGGVPIELTTPSFIAGVKVTDDPLGDYLLLTTTGTKTGTGATTIYTFTLLIDSVELQAYLVGITPSTNSTAFEVRDTVNNIATLPAITCSILPDYTLTGATPAAGSGTLVVDSGATFTVHKTFAMPVDDGQNNYVLKTNGFGVGSWAVDSAGTGTVQSVSVTTANGVSGTVATSTTTPAITLTLGAITPTTGAFSDTTDATNSTTAPLKTAGGLAVAKKAFIGTFLDLVATTATAGQITQAGSRIFHTFGGTGNIWLGLTTGNTAGALTGTNNIAIGTQAGKSITTGANNMFIGVQSGEFVTTGFNNTCMGGFAGYGIGAGTRNVAVGYASLQNGGTGGSNVAIGQASLQNISSGTLNVAIGSDAGDVDGIVVGGLTGKDISSGGNNTIIGAGAGSTLATGTYRTAIGSDSRCESNNAIKLGRDTLDVVLLPKMTEAQLATAATTLSTVKGAIAYCTDGAQADHVFFYNGSSWARIN